MIETRKGNLLDAKGIIVHGCNCQGVMGSGVALAIRTKWPIVAQHYMEQHRRHRLELGDVQYVVDVEPGVTVINAMTQMMYGRDSSQRYVSYDAVEAAFKHIGSWMRLHKHTSVNFPLLGAGLGGGDWEIIQVIIDRTLGDGIEKILWVQ